MIQLQKKYVFQILDIKTQVPANYHSINEFILLYFITFAVEKKFIQILNKIVWPHPQVVKNSIMEIVSILSIKYQSNIISKNINKNLGYKKLEMKKAVGDFLQVSVIEHSDNGISLID